MRQLGQRFGDRVSYRDKAGVPPALRYTKGQSVFSQEGVMQRKIYAWLLFVTNTMLIHFTPSSPTPCNKGYQLINGVCVCVCDSVCVRKASNLIRTRLLARSPQGPEGVTVATTEVPSSRSRQKEMEEGTEERFAFIGLFNSICVKLTGRRADGCRDPG